MQDFRSFVWIKSMQQVESEQDKIIFLTSLSVTSGKFEKIGGARLGGEWGESESHEILALRRWILPAKNWTNEEAKVDEESEDGRTVDEERFRKPFKEDQSLRGLDEELLIKFRK